MRKYWQSLTLVERIRLLRYVMPLVFIPIVIFYQLQIAFRLAEQFGHTLHYAAEITFYSFVGPVVTWLILVWVEKRLEEKETLELTVHARTKQLASLTAASPDAIISLDHDGSITSWNQGATQLFGYSANAILGQSIETLIPDFSDTSGQVLPEEGLPKGEITALGSEAQQIRVDLTQAYIDPIMSGQPSRLLIARDITIRSERAAILEEERARISRDLHDGVAQTLYFLALKADMLQSDLESIPLEAQSNLREISSQARAAIRDVRRAIFGLKPIDWERKGFRVALEEFVSDYGKEVNFKTVFKYNLMDTEIPLRLQPTIFRLIQESLNNVAKHATAKSVLVRLFKDPELPGLIIQIQDDGVGFEVVKQLKGFGLDQMNKRVKRAKGKLNINSQPGQGTIIEVVLPFRNW